MKYAYTHFIPENVAPKEALRMVVKNENGEVCSIPASQFGGLTPPPEGFRYSFGLVSDCHTFSSITNWNGNEKLKNALTYFMQHECAFVVGCGDFTQTGFYLKDSTDYNEGQMLAYKEILDSRSIPVYEIYGNHENYNGVSIVANLARAKELVGIPHTAYTVSGSADSDAVEGITLRPNRQEPAVGNDLFILIGQSESSKPMSTDAESGDFEWLKKILEANTHRRCLIFIHSFIDDDWGEQTVEMRDEQRAAEDRDGFIISDSGNPCGVRGNAIVGWWEDYATSTLTEFLDTLRKYPNAVIFHGHSHMKLESQEFDKCANYTDKNGFKSVHVPSLGAPRTLLDHQGNWTTDKGPDGFSEPCSQCYRVDVYEDCIVLNGLSFTGTEGVPVAVGTYRIPLTGGAISGEA